MCLDYMFEVFVENLENLNYEKKLKLNKNSFKVEKFYLVENSYKNMDTFNYHDNKHKCTQISDHYGLSCEFIYDEGK